MTAHTLRRLVVHDHRLRWPIPASLPQTVRNHTVLECGRRGKYLLIRFDNGTQIVHLGMSGSLRRVAMDEPRLRHDHVEWVFDDARFLFHDPRRFGAVLWHNDADGDVAAHPLLAHLGIEPFDARFDGAWLRKGFQGKTQAIKAALLAGHVVVGVGNIYASEALFKARINPKAAAGSLSPKRCERLAAAIRQTLDEALTSGGSTLRDYVDATGEPGAYFTLHAAVYDHEHQPCRVCRTPIRRMVQGQRATYYCPACQRY
jgi:formamidopyrimidine-DNA glycosylase